MAWEDLTRNQIELIKEDLRLTLAYQQVSRSRQQARDGGGVSSNRSGGVRAGGV